MSPYEEEEQAVAEHGEAEHAVGDDWEPQPPSAPPAGVALRTRTSLVLALAAVVLVALGTLLGIWLAGSRGDDDAGAAAADLAEQLRQSRARVAELERALLYTEVDVPAAGPGKLAEEDRRRHLRQGGQYVRALRNAQAQPAAHLLDWFVGRWNRLLDHPHPDDRVGRRAATLSLLVGGMAKNLDPKDYVAWQAEFFGGHWLGELHFDMDGDGLPGPRAAKNPMDGFADQSVCHIAMALNQAVTDVRVLVTPDMHCDRPESRMSVFLQGETFDDALTAFVAALRAAGFLVSEHFERGVRLILIGVGTKASNNRDR